MYHNSVELQRLVVRERVERLAEEYRRANEAGVREGRVRRRLQRRRAAEAEASTQPAFRV